MLPVAFIGKFDPRETVAKHWNDVWSENVGGDRSGIRLYAQDIVKLCSTLLGHASWALKKQGAGAIRELAVHIGSELSPANRDAILDTLR